MTTTLCSLTSSDPIFRVFLPVLAALILALARFGTSPRKSHPAMTLSVRWGREKLRVPIPAPDTKLGTLRAILAEQTGLPPTSFKLIHAGAIMKDDNAPLSAYGLRSGSRIALIDGGANAHTLVPPPAEEPAAQTKPTTEEGTIAVIRDELKQVQDRIVPALDAFLTVISPAPPSASAPSSAPEGGVPSSTSTETAAAPQPTVPAPPPSSFLPDVEAEHRRLGEELLQSLLRLDVLTLDGAWSSARTERKTAVKTVQALLDRLDGGWRERTERLTSTQQQQKVQ
ncbi:uncharacterized protein FOMMEDRAFT_140708 [Fomitiporia mediterranea MF3/22]|uniref:uncharacterized protein n=1 Tax=Fomitiporia mediterranea (strain MF3/22) TaxID=694068 RepID=UPI0004408CB0|nr:uncharacterized protein FOMMEDRAFT_140708 [Fomitiporia mediterranea MF3/22]EJD02888.1 hypothetical protein FOMMEDRAFT_140708 [Fomitiporia mediterranea MF3/22]